MLYVKLDIVYVLRTNSRRASPTESSHPTRKPFIQKDLVQYFSIDVLFQFISV
jgi:hypothetical protein